MCPFREVHLQSGRVRRQAEVIVTYSSGGSDGQHAARSKEGSLLAGRHRAASPKRPVREIRKGHALHRAIACIVDGVKVHVLFFPHLFFPLRVNLSAPECLRSTTDL